MTCKACELLKLEDEAAGCKGRLEACIPCSAEAVRISRRFLALYDSGELTTEALRELAIEMRKAVG